MKKILIRFTAFVCLLPALAFAEHTRVSLPNAVGLEFLGKAMKYSIFYDRVFTDELIAGFGIGQTSTQTASGKEMEVNARLFPFYLHYCFTPDQGSLFLALGANLVGNASEVKGLKSQFSASEFKSSVEPYFGIGYENRSDPGLLFRITAYGIYDKKLTPWGGLSLGLVF